MSDSGAGFIERTIRDAQRERGLAVIAFLTGGYPDADTFSETLDRVSREADVVEVGIPFSDPMADGVTIQRASHAAIERGTTLTSLMNTVARSHRQAPIVFMSYMNPLVRYGLDRLAADSAAAGVDGFVVPDLPLEEANPFRSALHAHGLALVQLVSPATPPARMNRIVGTSDGFVYAVTVNGTTGGEPASAAHVSRYLAAIRSATSLPVCAGFGIRTEEHVNALRGAADGVIVGSALIEAIDRGEDPALLVAKLRDATRAPARDATR